LGYFQPESVRHEISGPRSLPYVRRPTGGFTLLHHHELTYALALPARTPWQVPGEKPAAWLCRLHGLIAQALRGLGMAADIASCASQPNAQEALCFLHVTPGDLVIGGTKIVGSAQRKQHGALLQHGAILLSRSDYAPRLPGLLEMAGFQPAQRALQDAILTVLRGSHGWNLETADWSAEEHRRLDELVRTKYTQLSWTAKR
jgi:lipoate-protein ligase A